MAKENFKLDKWFLDFVGRGGEAMIFYAATLSWRDVTVPYTSWLSYDPETGISRRSRFRKVQMPEKKEHLIAWQDPKFGVAGSWFPLCRPVEARLFDSDEGYLDWHCFQPASSVQLQIGDDILMGRGYVEQLILTAYPWKLPMEELRWGRFASGKDQLVWIKMAAEDRQQWLWWNGEKVQDPIIEDDRIILPDRNAELKLGREVILESDKNIFAAVEKLLHHFPGFKEIIPLQFLMADSFKWLSKGYLQQDNKGIGSGMAIHEFVNFKAE